VLSVSLEHIEHPHRRKGGGDTEAEGDAEVQGGRMAGRVFEGGERQWVCGAVRTRRWNS
jgi:hypothetical protein